MPKRPIIIRDGVAYVPLTKGYEAAIDIADIPRVEAWNWTASVEKHTVYAMRKAVIDGAQRTVKMHRFLMAPQEGQLVDHRDGNGLNNVRCNLRVATHPQNMWNRRKPRGGKAGLVGVHWDNDRKKWAAVIQVNGKVRRLGRFETPEEGHQAYIEAARQLQGKFCAI
jgi:hypothetical protein